MKVIIDIEANSLTNPTQIWVIVCKDIDTNYYSIFRNITSDREELEKFFSYAKSVKTWIGHNCLNYDFPVLHNLIGLDISPDKIIDTLIISKLVDYSRPNKHSLKAYGEELGYSKLEFNDWTKYSKQMEDYCIGDVDICHLIYLKYSRIINDTRWHPSIDLEHRFQCVVNRLNTNGFGFNSDKANRILSQVTQELEILDKEILDAFPPRLQLVREVTPRLTQHGTLNRVDFRWVENGDLSEFNGGPFCKCNWRQFNPSSHKQLIEVLHQANWSPVDKTETHKDTERELNRLKHDKTKDNTVDINNISVKLVLLRKFGWKINETNLTTLPVSAPPPARLLAKRILYESRRRTLTEWLSLVQPDNRIHGQFQGIGAWTHRMAHQKPNTANIPNDKKEDGTTKLLGKELRSCWRAPPKRLLVGVDAEGIQLRIFAHYVNDPELIQSLVNGRKDNKTDPHSLNARVLGSICKSRQAAKRFLYALLLGGGVGKFAEILECTKEQAQEAVDKFNKRYPGFAQLKQYRFPSDAKRGFFEGLDGRRVPIPGDTLRDRQHLCMSGYLQNGEAIIMKRATLKWEHKLIEYQSLLVNLVHDEWQTEAPNNMEIAVAVATIQAKSLEEVGYDLKLNCPLAGSYWNEDKKDYTIGTNWSVTH